MQITKLGLPQMQGRKDWFVRGIWMGIALPLLVLFIINLSTYFDQLHTICISRSCDGRLTLSDVTILRTLGVSPETYALYFVVFDCIIALVHYIVAALLIWRKPQERMAHLGAYALLFWGIALLPQNLRIVTVVYPFWRPLVNGLAYLGVSTFTLFGYLFPDGRFMPNWSRWLAFIPIVAFLPGYIWPGSPADSDTWPQVWVGAIVLVWMGGIIGTQIYRYRRASNSFQRQQTRWVVGGVVGAALGTIGVSALPLLILSDQIRQANILPYIINYAGMRIAMLLIPLTVGIAILRHRLWNVDRVFYRTLVYGGLTAGVVCMYVLVVGYFSIGFKISNNPLVSLLATGIIAVAFQPMRERLQRAVNRFVYGQRNEPYAVIARLGQQLEQSLVPDAVLPMVVQTVATSLKLPYAAVALRYAEGETIAAAYGQPQEALARFPLTYRSEVVGTLLAAPRSSEEDFAPADQRLLTLLAQQAGIAAYSLRVTTELQQLTVDLQQSREQLVIAREEERRRLRRDLHDGVGPTLASLLQRIDATQYLVHDDPDAAVARLRELKAQVRTTIADIRRLVYALRPPAIDELGLLSAIREHIVQVARDVLTVRIDAVPDPLPPLPAAVEIAAYRIALEAFTNVQRHASATTCEVLLKMEDMPGGQALSVTVTDNGCGMPTDSRKGIGIVSMRERTAELGGTIRFEPGEQGGFCVYALLPFPETTNSHQKNDL